MNQSSLWGRLTIVAAAVGATNACNPESRNYNQGAIGEDAGAGGEASGGKFANGGNGDAGDAGSSVDSGGSSGAGGASGFGGANVDFGGSNAGDGNLGGEKASSGGQSAQGGAAGMAGNGGTTGTGAGGINGTGGNIGSGGMTPGVGCRWSCTGSNCVQVALDQDGDGHGTTVCAAAPGDDCNDADSSIHPGATELCDGIDNDCNAKVDLSDGLSLVGAIQAASAQVLTVASEESGTFGVLAPSSDGGFAYGTIDSKGKLSISTSALFSASSSNSYYDPHLAFGSVLGEWALTYLGNGKGGQFADAGLFYATGYGWQDTALPGGTSGRPNVTALGQGNLLMISSTLSTLEIGSIGASGSISQSDSKAITGTWDDYTPRVAASGNGAAALWQTAGPQALNWSAISSSIQFVGTPAQLSTSAYYADMAAISAGYGIAWVEGVGFRFEIKETTGNTLCTSSVIPFGTVPANKELALAGTASGTIVVVTAPDSNAISLFRLDDSCKIVDQINVSEGASAPMSPRVAVGHNHVVVLWTEGTNSQYRFLSDLLCQ